MSSPCVGTCKIDRASNLCVGCVRTAAEIASWMDASASTLDRIWRELPARRARLGIGMHRPRWTTIDIHAFVYSTLVAGGGSWSVGTAGFSEGFRIRPGEEFRVDRDGSRITAETDRGAIRFDVTEQVRALALPTDAGDEAIVLALPASCVNGRAKVGLTSLGPDDDAIRSRDRGDRLYDLGLGAWGASSCLRVSDLGVMAELDGRIGQGWVELAAEFGRIARASSARLILSPVGRLEGFTPIPPGDPDEDQGIPLGKEIPGAFLPFATYRPTAGKSPVHGMAL